MFGPRGLLAVFPSILSFYERIGMDDEHQQKTHVLYTEITHKLLLLACSVVLVHGQWTHNEWMNESTCSICMSDRGGNNAWILVILNNRRWELDTC